MVSNGPIPFVAYCAFGGLIAALFLRNLIYKYKKIELNHHPVDEALATKVVLLWRYNTIFAVFGVATTFGYSVFVSPLFDPITFELLAATAILFAVANTSIRIAAYGYVRSMERLEKDEKTLNEVKNRLYDSMFSFLVGLFFLLFFGGGAKVYTGNYAQTEIFPTGTFPDAIVLSLVIVMSTLIISIASELLLWIGPLKVPSPLPTEFDNRE